MQVVLYHACRVHACRACDCVSFDGTQVSAILVECASAARLQLFVSIFMFQVARGCEALEARALPPARRALPPTEVSAPSGLATAGS